MAAAEDLSAVDPDEDRSEIMQEWEELMQDFTPDEMLTFEVESKKEEVCMIGRLPTHN